MRNKIIELGYPPREVDELRKTSKNINDDYNKLLKKYPIQYLIGYVNFYGYKIYVNENVLIPRQETEFLVEKTIKYYKQLFNDNNVKVLDIGIGSGAISIALSKEINASVTGVDISKEALVVAKKNIEENNCDIKLINSDIFKNVKGKYDIIISNPPYIDVDEQIDDSVKLYEPHIALYGKDNGLYFYKEILKESKNYLNDKSILAFEIGCNQANMIKEIAMNYYEEDKIIIHKDLSGRDRYLFIINE